jgi:hypothetical protein
VERPKFADSRCDVCRGRGTTPIEAVGPDGYYLDPQPRGLPREPCGWCEGTGKLPTPEYSSWRTANAAAQALKRAGLPLGMSQLRAEVYAAHHDQQEITLDELRLQSNSRPGDGDRAR